MGLKSRAEGARKKEINTKTHELSSGDYGSKPVEIVSIIIEALGTIPKSLKRNLEDLGANVAPGLLQKSVVLETAHIIRRMMDS